MSSSDKKELVVSFLAMLELVKRGLLGVTQDAAFGEINMNYQGAMKAPNFE
jgi:chromatin segregation and condensation protein Rec8/ScpA/Scc1 (kleisin family)